MEVGVSNFNLCRSSHCRRRTTTTPSLRHRITTQKKSRSLGGFGS
ncbi:hypothetical protein LINPERHAP2_LOCUS88, partial [Linum perenne]